MSEVLRLSLSSMNMVWRLREAPGSNDSKYVFKHLLPHMKELIEKGIVEVLDDDLPNNGVRIKLNEDKLKPPPVLNKTVVGTRKIG